MSIDSLIRKLSGEMPKAWQKAHDYASSFSQREGRIDDEFQKIGKELCIYARRTLSVECGKLHPGTWVDVGISGPGYILDHSSPRALRVPYLSFSVSLKGNSYIRYNYMPKSKEDIDRVCIEIAKAACILRTL